MTPGRAATAGSTSRGSARSSDDERAAGARSDRCRLDDQPGRPGGADTSRSASAISAGRSSRATARPPSGVGQPPARSAERFATTMSVTPAAAQGRAGQRAHRAGADDQHASAGERAEHRHGVVERDRHDDAPARSMPVSVCTRLPTRSAVWARSCSTVPTDAELGRRARRPSAAGRGSATRRRPSSPGRTATEIMCSAAASAKWT